MCLFIILFGLTLLTGVLPCCIKDYRVPEPKITIGKPKGFSVQIPHSEGISLFAFHGKINDPMRDLEAGKFSKDILRKRGDFWIFEDNFTKLHAGDTIYFWLFVIKDGLGYRFDDGQYTVPDDTIGNEYPEEDPTTLPKVSTSTIGTDVEHTTKHLNEVTTVGPDSNTLIRICETTILNITDSLLKLQTELSSLKDTNEILKQIAEKNPKASKTLKIEGRIPDNEDALLVVKDIIKEKLALSIEVVEATRNKGGTITFEVGSLDDKVQIIKTAKEKLRYSRIYIAY